MGGPHLGEHPRRGLGYRGGCESLADQSVSDGEERTRGAAVGLRRADCHAVAVSDHQLRCRDSESDQPRYHTGREHHDLGRDEFITRGVGGGPDMRGARGRAVFGLNFPVASGL